MRYHGVLEDDLKALLVSLQPQLDESVHRVREQILPEPADIHDHVYA